MNQLVRIVFAIVVGVACCAQASYCRTAFKLVKQNGHYYTDVTINGNANTPVFVETGFPGLTLSVEMYDKILASLTLEEVKLGQEEWLQSDMAKHRIVKKLKGKVPVGDLCYDGFIFVVEPYDDKVTLPVNLLKNEADTTVNLIRFDFKKNTLDYVRREDVDLEKMRTYTLVKNDPMPVFESTMELSDTSGHNLTIDGNFFFDLGNGTAVFFFRESMLPILKKHKFDIQKTMDKAWNLVGYGVLVGYCKIGDKTKTGFPIGITNNIFESWQGQLGCVGPSFFKNGTVILDPKNKLIYYNK